MDVKTRKKCATNVLGGRGGSDLCGSTTKIHLFLSYLYTVFWQIFLEFLDDDFSFGQGWAVGDKPGSQIGLLLDHLKAQSLFFGPRLSIIAKSNLLGSRVIVEELKKKEPFFSSNCIKISSLKCGILESSPLPKYIAFYDFILKKPYRWKIRL